MISALLAYPETVAVQVEFHGAPGVRVQRVGARVGQLLRGEIFDAIAAIDTMRRIARAWASMVVGRWPLSQMCLRWVWDRRLKFAADGAVMAM